MSWLPVTVTVPPTAEPVSLAAAKAQCLVVGDDSLDELSLTAFIGAAREHVEAYTGTKIGAQTVVMRCARWSDLVALPTAPVTSIASIKYLDGNGDEQTLDPAAYEAVLAGLSPQVRAKVGRCFPATACADDAIRVEAVAGYSSAPKPIVLSMLLLINQWYENRSPAVVGAAVNEMPNTVEQLLANYRKF